MILKETVEQALIDRHYKILSATLKKKALQLRVLLPVYVNLTSHHGVTSLVLHPDSEAVDIARQIPGLVVSDS